jgi:hypothetical protein
MNSPNTILRRDHSLKNAKSKPNDILKFLEGTWTTTDFTVASNEKVKKEEYSEIMRIKDAETITITALGIRDGKDVTKDTTFKVVGDRVVMSQGDFSASGLRKENSVSLRGTYQNRTFDFRLYFLGDKYIYQKDVWENNRIVEIQMSYLLRSSK